MNKGRERKEIHENEDWLSDWMIMTITIKSNMVFSQILCTRKQKVKEKKSTKRQLHREMTEKRFRNYNTKNQYDTEL